MSDARVLRMKTPEECETFAKNVSEQYPALAKQVRRRAVELRARAYGVESDAEREALEAVYAVEEVMSQRNGRKTRAARTWQSFERHGILKTVERVVGRTKETDGYAALVEMGMDDFTFEAVVMRHPQRFPQQTIDCARARLEELKKGARKSPEKA